MTGPKETHMALFMIAFSVLFGFLAASIAQKKHRSFGGWFVVGALFGALGVWIAHLAAPLPDPFRIPQGSHDLAA